MKAITKKTKQQRQSRAAANSVYQRKNNRQGALAFEDNRPGPAAGRLTSVPNGPAGASKFIRLSAPSPDPPKSFSSTVVQRVIYASIPALLAAVWPGPGPVPNVTTFSDSLQKLFTDAEGQLHITDVIAAPGVGRIAEAGFNPAPPPNYILNYDPVLGAGNPNFLIASMLHELLHVSTQENYRKNGVPYDFLNMNLPPGLAIPAAVGNEVNAQLQILDQNLQDAVTVTNADPLLTPTPAIRAHVVNRLTNYARAMPDVHYDTVLADILAYLELNGINNGQTFDFITRMVNESTNRRLVNPWWGTKTARRVDRNKKFWQIWEW
jgi:hypothetical protein